MATEVAAAVPLLPPSMATEVAAAAADSTTPTSAHTSGLNRQGSRSAAMATFPSSTAIPIPSSTAAPAHGATDPPPPPHPSAPHLNPSSPVASTSSAQQRAGEICAAAEEKGGSGSGSPVRQKEEKQVAAAAEEKDDKKLKRKRLLKIKQESEACEEQKIQVSNKKRPRGNASESLRSKKAARTTEPKVSEAKRNYKSKMSRRRNSPIASGPHVSGSSMVNMLARRNAQSKLKSPSSNAISPIHGHHTPASLHDLSPAPPRGDSPDSFHDRLAPTPTHGSKRRPRKLTSIIWKEAEPIYIGGFLMQGRCNYCNTIFPASKLSGTSQLARHLRLCDVKCAMDGVVKQIRTSEEIDPDWRFDQESARVHLVNLVVLHGLPFSFVEYSGFRKFCTALNPWFKSISRVTVQNDCIEAYKQFKSNYQLDFKNFDHRVSLTGDMWTSNQKLGYLCLTCHWIDSKWKVQHRIIQFCLVETPHDSWNMFDVVLDSLRTWNIENKICSLTMDNAEVNTKMISHLRANLVGRDLIHHKGKLLHIRCAAHVLNLIVQDGLKTMGSVVDNIRNSVKYIRSSQHRIEQFDKMVVQEGIKCKHQPSLDVSTRWNSTFLMLESTLPFRKVFETLEEQEPSYTFGPSDKEWEMVVDICKLLKVFCRATNVISGSNYPTANLYFLEIWSVKVVLDEQEKSSNDTIRIMVKEMKLKFHKYFMESYLTNCIPVILDPRFKFKHVEFRLKQYFGPDAHTHIIEVKQAMAALFLGYESESNGSTLSQEENDEEAGLAADVLTDWDEHVKQTKAARRCELQLYLEEDFHPRVPDFDILKWWSVNSQRYPILGRIARDVLAVPASTVASESAFSTSGRVISDHRTCLGAESVEALMCYGDWIRRVEKIETGAIAASLQD